MHEAFFDPALNTTTSAVGAGGADGVLKPASFTFEGVGTTTIERIEWVSDSVRMELNPHGRLTGHHIDFIELDGSVGLRLDFDAAEATTAEGGGQALTWGVCQQPWQDGDLLMLRISVSGPDLPNVTNDMTCGSNTETTTPISTTTALAPQNLTAQATLDSITLSWDAPAAGASGYRITRRVQGPTNEFEEMARVAADANGYVDTTDIKPNTHYIYRVQALDERGHAVADARAEVVTPS